MRARRRVLCFPLLLNEVLRSVPLDDVGVAAGTNTALRELGGVFGVAVVGAVLAATGSYATPDTFVAVFQPAILVAAAISFLGLTTALLAAPARGARFGTHRRSGRIEARTD